MADLMCLFPLGRHYWSNKISIGVHVKRWCRPNNIVSHKWRMNSCDGNVSSRYKQMLQKKMPIHRISVRSSPKWITLKWRRYDGSVCGLNDVSQKQRHACVTCVRVCECVISLAAQSARQMNWSMFVMSNASKYQKKKNVHRLTNYCMPCISSSFETFLRVSGQHCHMFISSAV